jgi:hypothetical protein
LIGSWFGFGRSILTAPHLRWREAGRNHLIMGIAAGPLSRAAKDLFFGANVWNSFIPLPGALADLV